MNKLRTLALSLLFALGFAAATSGEAHAAWRNYTVTTVGCFDNGRCFIEVSPQVPSSHSSCANKSQVRFSITSAGGEAMYKTAMAAFLAGRQLAINVYSGGSCLDGYPRAWYVRFAR